MIDYPILNYLLESILKYYLERSVILINICL